MRVKMKKRSIEDILKECLPNESLFCIANKDYNPDEDQE
jgi:hypothetical protein